MVGGPLPPGSIPARGSCPGPPRGPSPACAAAAPRAPCPARTGPFCWLSVLSFAGHRTGNMRSSLGVDTATSFFFFNTHDLYNISFDIYCVGYTCVSHRLCVSLTHCVPHPTIAAALSSYVWPHSCSKARLLSNLQRGAGALVGSGFLILIFCFFCFTFFYHFIIFPLSLFHAAFSLDPFSILPRLVRRTAAGDGVGAWRGGPGPFFTSPQEGCNPPGSCQGGHEKVRGSCPPEVGLCFSVYCGRHKPLTTSQGGIYSQGFVATEVVR